MLSERQFRRPNSVSGSVSSSFATLPFAESSLCALLVFLNRRLAWPQHSKAQEVAKPNAGETPVGGDTSDISSGWREACCNRSNQTIRPKSSRTAFLLKLFQRQVMQKDSYLVCLGPRYEQGTSGLLLLSPSAQGVLSESLRSGVSKFIIS